MPNTAEENIVTAGHAVCAFHRRRATALRTAAGYAHYVGGQSPLVDLLTATADELDETAERLSLAAGREVGDRVQIQGEHSVDLMNTALTAVLAATARPQVLEHPLPIEEWRGRLVDGRLATVVRMPLHRLFTDIDTVVERLEALVLKGRGSLENVDFRVVGHEPGAGDERGNVLIELSADL